MAPGCRDIDAVPIRPTLHAEIYLHELEVDRGVADIFETITHEITHGTENAKENGVTVLQ